MIFVLGSHVRHIGAGARITMLGDDLDANGYAVAWVPLCRQRSGTPWRIAATPAQNSRPVCTRCVGEVRKIAQAVL